MPTMKSKSKDKTPSTRKKSSLHDGKSSKKSKRTTPESTPEYVYQGTRSKTQGNVTSTNLLPRIDEAVTKSKVNRENKGVQTIKMKLDLDLLKESRECLDEDYYKAQVRKLTKEMLSENKASEDVDGLESSSDEGEVEDSNVNNDDDDTHEG
jgi:hypothetical protein